MGSVSIPFLNSLSDVTSEKLMCFAGIRRRIHSRDRREYLVEGSLLALFDVNRCIGKALEACIVWCLAYPNVRGVNVSITL